MRMIAYETKGTLFVQNKKSSKRTIIPNVTIVKDYDFLGRFRLLAHVEDKAFDSLNCLQSHYTNIATSYGEVYDDIYCYIVWYPSDQRNNGFLDISKAIDEQKSKNNTAFADITILYDGIGHCDCSKCHKRINHYDKFCRHCGSEIIAQRVVSGG